MGGWHEQLLRVRFEETDMMGVVYYAKFFVWMEVGRISLLRDIGLAYRDWEAKGLNLPVVQAHADYRASARLDDEVLVRTRVSRVGNTSIRFENVISTFPDRRLLCTGHTVHALVGRNGKPRKVPEEIRTRLTSS